MIRPANFFGFLAVALLVTATRVEAASDRERLAALMTGVIERCWSRPPETEAVTVKRIVVKLRLAPDGSIEGKPQTQAAIKTAADDALVKSAVRAVLRCEPFTALLESGIAYDMWRDIDLTFAPGP